MHKDWWVLYSSSYSNFVHIDFLAENHSNVRKKIKAELKLANAWVFAKFKYWLLIMKVIQYGEN